MASSPGKQHPNSKLSPGVNDLATLQPTLAQEWHPTKNGALHPADIYAGSAKKVWWLGKVCGHAWDASVEKRARHGRGCPICSNQRVLNGFNDLATTHPDIAAHWHPAKNGELLPTMVIAGSSKKHWWFDETCGHEWYMALDNVIHLGRNFNCKICVGSTVVPGINDLATTHPHLIEEWDATKNTIAITAVSAGSTFEAWWQCQHGHTWEAPVYNRTGKTPSGCPACAGRRVQGVTDLVSLYPEVAAQWHPTKNKTLPEQHYAGDTDIVWWLGQCGHDWRRQINAKIKTNSECPTCEKKNRLPAEAFLPYTHPEVAAQWHPTRNTLQPEDVLSTSEAQIWWLCDRGHEWPAPVSRRTRQGSACPVCVNRIVVAGQNDLGTTHPMVAARWHPVLNLARKPISVTAGSGYYAWWLCEICDHAWQRTVQKEVKSYGCPLCNHGTSRGETDIAQYLNGLGLAVQRNTRSVLQNGQEIDIYLPQYKLGIEYNGLYWHSEEQGKHRAYHRGKFLAAQQAGIRLIQIWEDDWLQNPAIIKKMLLHKLGLDTSARVGARKTVVKEITLAQANRFLAEHHIQGAAPGSVYLSLQQKSSVEPIAVMVLKWERQTTLNILRYATSARVPGGFTKLVTYASKNLQPERFITFSDNMVSDGALYANNGFARAKELRPDYMYIVNDERKHKFGYRLKKFRDDPTLLWDPKLSESQLAKLNGIPRVWDAGKVRWLKEVSKTETG